MAQKHSFASRLSLKIILVTSIILILALIVMAATSIRISEKASVKYATELLHATISELESPIIQSERITDGVARALEEFNHCGAQLDTANFYELLESSIKSCSYILGMGVYYEPNRYKTGYQLSGLYVKQDQHTREITKEWGDDDDPSYVDWDYFNIDWYADTKENGKPMWFPPFFDLMDSGDSLLMTTYSFPAKDKDSVMFAVCSTDLLLDWVKGKLESLKPYPKSNIIIVDENLNYICNPLSQTPYQGTMFDTPFITGMNKTFDSERDAEWIWKEMKEKGSVTIKSDGKRAFCVMGKMCNGWIVSINTLYADAFRDIFVLFGMLAGLALFGTLFLYASSHHTVKRESAPLVDFARAASKITDGHFDVPIPELKTDDEISDLGDALRYMQISVTDYIEKLKVTTSEKERLASELNVSRNIQKQMLTTDFPKMPKGGLNASCTPAREVGGDLYDFFFDGRELFFLLGDVSGKGVPAALLMAITIAAFRSLRKHEHPVEEMMFLVNRTFCHSSKDMMFVTAVIGRIDTETGEMSFCNAGHNPMLYISPEGKAEYIKAKPNLVVGVMNGFEFQPDSFKMEPGSRLLVYTDGITEAEAPDKAQYGEDRLLAFAEKTGAGVSDEKFVNDLLASVETFTKGNEPNDDRTILSISI